MTVSALRQALSMRGYRLEFTDVVHLKRVYSYVLAVQGDKRHRIGTCSEVLHEWSNASVHARLSALLPVKSEVAV